MTTYYNFLNYKRLEDTCVSSSVSLSFIQDCSKCQLPGEVDYETHLPNLGIQKA